MATDKDLIEKLRELDPQLANIEEHIEKLHKESEVQHAIAEKLWHYCYGTAITGIFFCVLAVAIPQTFLRSVILLLIGSALLFVAASIKVKKPQQG